MMEVLGRINNFTIILLEIIHAIVRSSSSSVSVLSGSSCNERPHENVENEEEPPPNDDTKKQSSSSN